MYPFAIEAHNIFITIKYCHNHEKQYAHNTSYILRNNIYAAARVAAVTAATSTASKITIFI